MQLRITRLWEDQRLRRVRGPAERAGRYPLAGRRSRSLRNTNTKSNRMTEKEPAENMAAQRLPSMFTPEQHANVFTCGTACHE